MDWHSSRWTGASRRCAVGSAPAWDDGRHRVHVHLRRPHPTPVDVRRDRARLLRRGRGRAGRTAWLTGRGADGRLHLFGRPIAGTADESVAALAGRRSARCGRHRSLDARAAPRARLRPRRTGPGGCAPTTSRRRSVGGAARGRGFALGSEPDTSLSFSFHEQGPLVVAGRIGDGPAPAPAPGRCGPRRGPRPDRELAPGPPVCRLPTDLGRRRRHALTAAASGSAGRVDGRPRVTRCCRCPSAGWCARRAVAMPPLELVAETRPPAAGRSCSSTTPRATSPSSSPPPPGATGCAGTTAASGRRSRRPTVGCRAACARAVRSTSGRRRRSGRSRTRRAA